MKLILTLRGPQSLKGYEPLLYCKRCFSQNYDPVFTKSLKNEAGLCGADGVCKTTIEKHCHNEEPSIFLLHNFLLHKL